MKEHKIVKKKVEASSPQFDNKNNQIKILRNKNNDN
jgi:hypothetical protein